MILAMLVCFIAAFPIGKNIGNRSQRIYMKWLWMRD